MLTVISLDPQWWWRRPGAGGCTYEFHSGVTNIRTSTVVFLLSPRTPRICYAPVFKEKVNGVFYLPRNINRTSPSISLSGNGLQTMRRCSIFRLITSLYTWHLIQAHQSSVKTVRKHRQYVWSSWIYWANLNLGEYIHLPLRMKKHFIMWAWSVYLVSRLLV